MSQPQNSVMVQFVTGGFAVQTYKDGEISSEVFMSPGKLMRALRASVDELSLIKKEKTKDEGESDAQ